VRPAGYPLASLLSLRERERDDAARALSHALELLAQVTEAQRVAAGEQEQAGAALAAYQPLHGAAVGAGELELRGLHRERLRAARDQARLALQRATEQARAAEAHVDAARASLAAARAAHRAVELHQAEHRARALAAAQAREEDALDEAAQTRARGPRASARGPRTGA
jgi:flagellar biosynthesis chaperone FliJ